MRVKTTVLVAAVATMVIGAATIQADQPGKRSVLRVSNNNGSRSVVRPVGFDDDLLPQEPPIHQPPQVNAYTQAPSRKVITLQQQAPRQMLPQRGQQLFAQPVTRRVSHLENIEDTGTGTGAGAEPSCGCHAAAPAASCCGHEGGCGGSPCCGHETACCASPCCASPCCASPCCESSCCGSSCCGGGLSSLFGGHCGCGHHGGCCNDCCGGCETSCGCAPQHCGCGDCCHSCCRPCVHAVDVFGFLKGLFSPCCCHGGCHSACHCGGCAVDYGCSTCGGHAGGCAGGAAGMPEGVPSPMPMPNNGSPSDVPPPPKVQ